MAKTCMRALIRMHAIGEILSVPSLVEGQVYERENGPEERLGRAGRN